MPFPPGEEALAGKWGDMFCIQEWSLKLRCFSKSKNLAGFAHTLELFSSVWSQDLGQKLRAEILRILAAVARPELNSEDHFWPKIYQD